jgi:HK97 family phage portal protein
MRNWLPALFSHRRLTSIEQQLKAVQTLFLPQLTATLSQQIFANRSIVAPVYPDWTVQQASRTYTSLDQVYAVINKIAETTSLIPFYVYYQKSEKHLRRLHDLTMRLFYTSKGLYDIRLLQMKALEDAPESDPLVKLLANPNPYQSQQEFFLACFCYYLLHGECFIYKFRPDIGGNQGRVSELYTLSPSMIIIHVSSDYPQSIIGYEFGINGTSVYKQLPPEDIIHIKKFNPENTCSFDALANNYARFRGLSPLIPAKKLLTRLTTADDASVSQLQHGGLPGLVFDAGNPDQSTEALSKMKLDFHQYLQINKGLPLFTSGTDWKYLPMGLKLADMELLGLQNMDFKRLCNIYKISTILFNSEVAATESNVEEMIKQMYTNVCLPLAYTFRDKFNHELIRSENFRDSRTRYIDVDISNITELQDDYKDLANVLATLPITPTGNEMRELFKWDKIEQEIMDIPLIKSGYEPITALEIPMPQE